jgi:hypothetical protein
MAHKAGLFFRDAEEMTPATSTTAKAIIAAEHNRSHSPCARSVRLTEAGERLYASLRPALDEVHAAVAAVGELGDEPRGTLRLHTSTVADSVFRESFITGFLTSNPNVASISSLAMLR